MFGYFFVVLVNCRSIVSSILYSFFFLISETYDNV